MLASDRLAHDSKEEDLEIFVVHRDKGEKEGESAGEVNTSPESASPADGVW